MKLSIGVRWALRYTAAMSVTLTIFAIVVYTEVERRINTQAHVVAEIQARELVESLRSHEELRSRAELLAWLEERAERAVRDAGDLGLGIEYLDRKGKSLVSAGSLAGEQLPVPVALLEGEQESSLRAVNLGGEYAHLLSVLAAPGGFLQVAVDTRRYAENIDRVRDVLMLSFPLTLGLTALFGWLLARGSLRPISEIIRTTRRISGSNLRDEIPTTGSEDELDQLAHTLNEMMGRIREGVGRMLRFNSHAAHELRTPLSAICSQIEVTLERQRSVEEYHKVLEGVLDRAHHLTEGVNAMLRLSRSEAGLDPKHVKPVQIAPLLEELVEFFDPVANDQGRTLVAGPHPHVAVQGDVAWLRQLFSNLLDNAIKYCGPGDRIEVRAQRDGTWLRVIVSDDGPGIQKKDLREIFDRFRRGAHGGHRTGFGLGLPLAEEIARAHGGRIEAESEPGDGTTFTVWLPVADAPLVR